MARITVVIPTSVIPSHPSTEILDRTLASVRTHLPDAPIILTCDGLQPSHEIGRVAYEDYIERAQASIQALSQASMVVFEAPIHQSGMLATVLPRIQTSLLLYLEHDWELKGEIEWDVIQSIVETQMANYVKFYQGQRIHPLHEHMMYDRFIWKGAAFIKTVQYSANPHVASVEWYRQFLPLFQTTTDYIENILHGPIAISKSWEQYRCLIYNPILGEMKRSFHLDGAGTGLG